MARYGDEFKRSIMMKMMPPQNQSISQVARETGLSEATLHLWRLMGFIYILVFRCPLWYFATDD
jgi:hypothetical protein